MPSGQGRDLDQLMDDIGMSDMEDAATAMWLSARRHPTTSTCFCPLVEGIALLYELGYRMTKEPRSMEPAAKLAAQIAHVQQNEAKTAPLPTPRTLAPQGCDDCSVEPGETHRHEGCPGAERQRQRDLRA